MDFQSKGEAITNFLHAMQALKSEGILTNKKDFTCQIGEWLVETIYEGERARNAIQRGWDVLAQGKYIQVKTHAKAVSNGARFTRIEKESTEHIDELVLIVFTEDYKLKEFYKIPWEIAATNIRPRGKKFPKNELKWSSIKDFEIKKELLPHQDIIALFS